jgi:hypothetical protein
MPRLPSSGVYCERTHAMLLWVLDQVRPLPTGDGCDRPMLGCAEEHFALLVTLRCVAAKGRVEQPNDMDAAAMWGYKWALPCRPQVAHHWLGPSNTHADLPTEQGAAAAAVLAVQRPPAQAFADCLDSIMKVRTEGVNRFQQDKGLTLVDGLWGPETHAAYIRAASPEAAARLRWLFKIEVRAAARLGWSFPVERAVVAASCRPPQSELTALSAVVGASANLIALWCCCGAAGRRREG